ncbi:MAG: ABC transporter family substrate-binding protein [Corynebacterium sp.]|nr:ABC transporter family substrate-binding protein [Corynebacterium sp.]
MIKLRRASLLPFLTVCIASCAAAPGPAPIEEPQQASQTTTTTSAPRKQAKELSVGIDPVHTGFNPHLLADDSRFIQTLAGLILPSVFIDNRLNTDLITKVEELNQTGDVISTTDAEHPEGQESITNVEQSSTEPTSDNADDNGPVKTIRYELAAGAQWSDGTPITVADFEYLWSSMLNTPGTLNPAGYWAITDIRSTKGGKTIEVDFNKNISNWRTLFTHLLPSHVLRGVSFTDALSSGVPVSAGKFTMKTYDRNRGIIALNRNDRFWGKETALVESLNFHEVRSTDQGIELVQNNQISFMDVTPTETSKEAYSLVPKTQTRTEIDKYTLEIVANTRLAKPLRKELRSLIDPDLISRLAYDRRTDLAVIPKVEESVSAIGLQSLNRNIIIGVDPAEPVTASAAKNLVNSLIKQGVPATIKNADTNELMQTLIPRGQVDAVVAKSGTNLADNYACPNIGLLGSNRSGYCQADTQAMLNDYLTGTRTEEELTDYLNRLEADEALRTAIAFDTRLEILGTGITGPDADLAKWPTGYNSIDTWRIHQ